jgi:hypothetical protein
MPHYANVAVVAQSGGNYPDPVSAMNALATWCGTPSATNPCLVKIMPGVYNLTNSLDMSAYVDIEGSGEDVTTLQGNVDGLGTGLIQTSSNAELRFLTVENNGPNNSIAIYSYQQSPKLTHVTAISSGALNFNLAISNNFQSSTIMTNVTAIASGGFAMGIDNANGQVTMMNVSASATCGSSCRAIENDQGGSTLMMNVIANAIGAGGIGIENYGSSPTMMNVNITAATGIYNLATPTVKINNSIITSTTPVYSNPSTPGITYVGSTQINGGSMGGSSSVICAGVYDGNYVFYANTCP